MYASGADGPPGPKAPKHGTTQDRECHKRQHVHGEGEDPSSEQGLSPHGELTRVKANGRVGAGGADEGSKPPAPTKKSL
jgi:hypothetical protein